MLATAGSARPMPENPQRGRREQRHLRAGPLGPGLPRAGRVLPRAGPGLLRGRLRVGRGRLRAERALLRAERAVDLRGRQQAVGTHRGRQGHPARRGPPVRLRRRGLRWRMCCPVSCRPPRCRRSARWPPRPRSVRRRRQGRPWRHGLLGRWCVSVDGLASPGGRTGRDLRRTRGRPRASGESVGCCRTSGSPSCRVRQPEVQHGHDRHLQGWCPAFRGVAPTLSGNAESQLRTPVVSGDRSATAQERGKGSIHDSEDGRVSACR